MLSVVIPCFNRERRIAETLHSLGAFHGWDLEIIVVDDGSVDGSVEAAELTLAQLASHGIQGRVVRGAHRGACAARNLGYRESRGKWVMFLDSDDPADASGLVVLCRAMDSPARPDVAYGWVSIVNENSEPLGKSGVPVDPSTDFVFQPLWHTSGAVYRRELLDRCGGWNETLTLGDDWEFGARVRLHTERLHFANVCVGFYVQHGDGRLTTDSYNRDKCRSVIKATLLIRRTARTMGRLDRSLKRRVFRRLLVQSSELAIHKGGSPAWALIRIISTQSVDLISAFGALLFRSSPGPKARALLYRSFRAKGLRPAAAATTKATIFAAPGAACDPLVSIIVPTYERADMIPELLRSVADQAYRPVEIVIVDDGSTDNTAAVIQDFVVSLARDAGLFVKYHSGARRGAPAARNKGIALASGQYLMFADSDDAFAGGGIGDLVRHLAAHPAWGYAYGKVLQADSHFVAIAGREFVGSSFRAASGADLAGYHWHTMGALYRRSCVDKVGAWNEDLSGSQDWEYQARMKMFGGGCGLVDTLVGYWRHHDLARVGTKSFRPDYVDSVMKACASILDHARHAGKCDATLEAKIARRLVVHALEWSANGRRGDRNRCLQQARNSLSSNMVLSWVVRMMTYLPQQIDVWLFAILHGAQAKRLPNLRKRS